MKKILFLLASALLLSAFMYVNDPQQQNYTVPSWTLYQRALQSGQSVDEAKALLVSKEFPYNINTTLNGDPTTQIGVAWFTNAGVTGGMVQIVEGNAFGASAFSNARTIAATYVAVDTINYVSLGRADGSNNSAGLMAATGFSAGEKRSYTSNKALINHLYPNTTYFYRVGKEDAWSPVGAFTTAKENKESFQFIYITDTQANTDDNFEVSQKTIEAAYEHVPDAKFVLITGDHIESAGLQSSEWEWEQWFEKMQHIWLRLPIAPTQGNHDASPFGNFEHHFNTNNTFNQKQSDDQAKTAMNGVVYSFVYGDALFMMISYEDFRKGEPYFAALEQWMREEVSAHTHIKWKIAAFHKTMFTGAGHQNGSDGRIVRERFAPLFQELKIDLAFQGHDHVYEVIGIGTTTSGEGVYDVSNGVLYFLNNSAGKKKYQPRTQEQMEAAFEQHGVNNYFELFYRLGQTGEPTFSHVTISTEAIDIATYTVNDDGTTALFDAFKIVKK
ncbi:MAG: metallophosphoesterase family protein [Bacteroidales bacterium]|nr:metallophosphoesterase family protein [Bacteroidales bacterium]